MDKNEEEVNKRLLEVLATHAENKPPSEATIKEEKLKVIKLNTRIGFIKEKAKSLKNTILGQEMVKDMTDNEVREGMMENKKLEEQIEKLILSKEKLEEDAVGIDIDPADLIDIKEIIHDAVNVVEDKMENLKMEDKSRGLFSLSKTENKVVFPEPFSGKYGENVFLFKRKFEQAILGSQIRQVDIVQVFMKHLKGQAKELMSEHFDDLTTAMDSLVDYFGNPDQIWKKSIETLKKKLLNKNNAWGSHGGQQKVWEIAHILEFLRACKGLANEIPYLESDIYNKETLKLLRKVIPRDFREQFDKLVGRNETIKEDIEDITGFMESNKDAAIKLARLGLDDIDCTKSYSDKNLNQFEHQYCYEFEEAAFQLRKARKIIYNKLSVNENVQKEIQRYRFQVNQFVQKFKTQLKSDEIKIWKNKIRRTETDVKDKAKAFWSFEEAFARLAQAQAKDRTQEAPEREVLIPTVKEVLDETSDEETLVQNLPSVPADDQIDDKNKVDEEIEDRLNKLKFFNKVWNSGIDSNEEAGLKEIGPNLRETVKIDSSRQHKRSFNPTLPPLKSQEPAYRKFPNPHSQDKADPMGVKYDGESHRCCNCCKESLNGKEIKVVNVQTILMVIIAISQLLFHSSNVQVSSLIFPPLSSAPLVPVMKSPTLLFSAFVSRTKKYGSALAIQWLRWIEARIKVRARSVNDSIV